MNEKLENKAEKFPEIVTLRGSTRFKEEFFRVMGELTLEGKIVILPGVFIHCGEKVTEEQKKRLDELHLRKIDLANSVFIINPGGYMGESTKREIVYAQSKGKK